MNASDKIAPTEKEVEAQLGHDRFLFDVCLVGTCLLFFIRDPDGDGDGDGINFAADDPNL